MDVDEEPRGVVDLMARTEADLKRRMEDPGDDARAAEWAELRETLAALRAEYGGADFPRRSAIERELRALVRRQAALESGARAPSEVAPDTDTADTPDIPDVAEEDLPAPPGPPAMAAGDPAGRAPGDADAAPPHGPVPLGPESAVRPGHRGRSPEEHHAAVPLGPESAVRASGAPTAPPPPGRPGPDPSPAAGQAGPIPHGAPGPGFAAHGPERPPDALPHDHPEPDPFEDGGPGGAWWTRTGTGVSGWLDRLRLAVAREVLLRKREARLMELGARIRQMEARGSLGAVQADAGVRARLAQVAQVDAELARVDARRGGA